MPDNATRKARALYKAAANATAMALTLPCWLPARLQRALTGGEGFFNTGAELLSMAPGKAGVYLRRGFYRMCLESCGSDCHIGFGTTLSHPQVRIGRGVYVGNCCTVGRAVLEDHVTIGSNVDLLSGRRQHNFDDPIRPIQEQGGIFTRIRIGCNCWIGNGSIVMADVGPRSVIGAGGVVVKPIPAGAVAVGNPARVIRTREMADGGAPRGDRRPTDFLAP